MTDAILNMSKRDRPGMFIRYMDIESILMLIQAFDINNKLGHITLDAIQPEDVLYYCSRQTLLCIA